jgi:hypothetical protein
VIRTKNYSAPKTIIKPEISANWVAANKLKPDLKTFYDSEWDRGQRSNKGDFDIDMGVKIDDGLYCDYMKNYVGGFTGMLSG